jgi:LPS export ABC transporter protein LptC/lipopolysaccharide transport protein LptA
MTPAGARTLRRALLASVAAVVILVLWSLRRPPPLPAPAASGTPEPGTTMSELVYLRFREGSEAVQVKARAMSGREGASMRLLGCEIVFPFVSRGQPSRATVKAEECLYEPEGQHAWFQGRVRVATEDGLALDTESLEYRGDDGVARTPDLVSFRRRSTSGTARGLEYREEAGRLELLSDVRLRLEKEGVAPTEIGAARAVAQQRRGIVTFSGGVRLVQAGSDLVARRLQLEIDDATETPRRAVAVEDVEVRSGAEPPGGTPSAARVGERRLRCRRLDVLFRDDGSLLEATAVNRASLSVEPGVLRPAERRRVEAHLLHFAFDEQGRLQRLEGRRAAARRRRRGEAVVLSAEAVPPAGEGARRVTCHSFEARMDPTAGRLRDVRFEGDVVFLEPGRRALAPGAEYEEASGRLTLLEQPRLIDEREGSDLRAGRIAVMTRTGSLSAGGGVQQTVTRADPARRGFLSTAEPALLRSQTLDYDAARRTARYRAEALLRAGRDEVRADEIVIEEKRDGSRRLVATGGVVSLLHPRKRSGAGAEPAPVEARSREMVFDEAARRVVYRGETLLRQGDIRTRSPEAVVTLGEEGGSIERVVAGEPVEVEQGRRKASGRQATYTPETETIVLVGDEVVLEEADRRVVGGVLTFQVGADRVRVDGREDVRTEATFKPREVPKP